MSENIKFKKGFKENLPSENIEAGAIYLANDTNKKESYLYYGENGNTIYPIMPGKTVKISQGGTGATDAIKALQNFNILTANGGVKIGGTNNDTAATMTGLGGAIGLKAVAAGGGAVGEGATTENGGAVGYNARATNQGGSVGRGARTESGGAVGNLAYSEGGGAVGESAKAGKGGAIGYGAFVGTKNDDGSINTYGTGGAVGRAATTIDGGAVGYEASSSTGGAVGQKAESSDGFAGGLNAKALADGAVQLGEGTNEVENTLQFRGTQIVNENGEINSSNLSIVPVSQGGTGASNALDGLKNLGIITSSGDGVMVGVGAMVTGDLIYSGLSAETILIIALESSLIQIVSETIIDGTPVTLIKYKLPDGVTEEVWQGYTWNDIGLMIGFCLTSYDEEPTYTSFEFAYYANNEIYLNIAATRDIIYNLINDKTVTQYPLAPLGIRKIGKGVAIGTGAGSLYDNAVALGNEATAYGEEAVQLGPGVNEDDFSLQFRDQKIIDGNNYFIASQYGTEDPPSWLNFTPGAIYYKIIE